VRRKPFTDEGLKHKPCTRCGHKPSTHQWNIEPCSLGKEAPGWIPICVDCDLLLNEMLVHLIYGARFEAKLAIYRDPTDVPDRSG
jgi:hypothetical protein